MLDDNIQNNGIFGITRARAPEIFARKYIFYLTLNRLAGRRRAMNSMEIYARAPPSLSLAETERTRSTYTGASLAGPIWALYDRPIASFSSMSITIYKNRRLLGGEEPPMAEHIRSWQFLKQDQN